MAAIVNSVEVSRRPEDVFSYMTDPSNLPAWQESVVSAQRQGDDPIGVGSRVVVTRRVGPREMSSTSEFSEFSPPRGFVVRGIDGPVRGIGRVAIEPLDGGTRSRVTFTVDFESHGIGKLLLPLVVRRQASAEMPRNLAQLKRELETEAS